MLKTAPLLLLLLALATAAPAQEQTPAQEPPSETTPVTQPTTRPSEIETLPTELSAENIQARLAQLEGAADLPEATRTEAAALYRQALEQLSAAATWASKAAEFQRGREEAPQRLEAARQALAQATSRPATQPVIDLPPDTTLEQLAQREAEVAAELKTRQDALSALDVEAQQRQERMAALPELLAEANARWQTIQKEAGAPLAAGVPTQVAQARRDLLAARQRAVEQELKALDEELRFYGARGDVLAARRDRARLDVNETQARLAALQKLVSERRQLEVERQRQQAEEELARTPRAIRELAERNKELAESRVPLTRRIDAVQEETRRIAERTAELDRQFKRLREQLQQPELVDVIGPQLRAARDRLAQLRPYERDYEDRKRELSRLQIEQALLEEERAALANVEAEVVAALEDLTPPVAPARLRRLEDRARELLLSRREAVEALGRDYEQYAGALIQIISAEKGLLTQVAGVRDFLDAHMLWLPSAAPLHRTRWPADWQAGLDVPVRVARALGADARQNLPACGLAVLVVGVLLALRPRLRARLRAVREKVTHPYTDSFTLTLKALAYTVLFTLPWPVLLWFVGARCSSAASTAGGEVYDAATAYGHGFIVAGRFLLISLFLWHLVRPHGLGEAHFRWNADALRLVRRHLAWFVVLLLPLGAVVAATEARLADSPWRDSLGRLAFMATMLPLTLLTLRLLHPRTGIFAVWLDRHAERGAARLRYVWYVLLVATPLAFAVAAAIGYQYTAVQLAARYLRTVVLLLALLVIHALLTRALLVAQRRLAIEQARKRRAAQAEAKSTEAAGGEAGPPLEEAALNLVTIGTQTRHLLRMLVFFGVVLGLWVTWVDMLPALGFLEHIRLWSYTAETAAAEGQGALATTVRYITLAHLIGALLISIATFVLARNIPGLLEIVLLQRLPLDASSRFAITSVARYTIVTIGVVTAFGTLGIGWSKVQWLVTAMLVGLGFGLQEIFANFISGLMLLFERPIRIGDTVTVGGISGTVTRIRIRATTITDWDRKELIIPNKEFITGQVINWTLSDQMLRITLPVGIAYGSNTQRAEEVLYKVARAEPNVLAEPEPRVIFMSFGDNSLNFELRVFVPSVDFLLQTRHRLLMAIDREFRQAGIEIAFPQRDLHIRSIHAPIRVIQDDRGRTLATDAPSHPET